jgi:hypothetical protein
LAGVDEVYWQTGRSKVQRGDLVAIWKYKGSETWCGVIGFGRVTSDPEDRPDHDDPGWKDGRSDPLTSVRPRVKVSFVLLTEPLSLEDEPFESVVWRLKVVGSRGTVFKVESGDWEELIDLAKGRNKDLPLQTDRVAEPVMNTTEIVAIIPGITGLAGGVGGAALIRSSACSEMRANANPPSVRPTRTAFERTAWGWLARPERCAKRSLKELKARRDFDTQRSRLR